MAARNIISNGKVLHSRQRTPGPCIRLNVNHCIGTKNVELINYADDKNKPYKRPSVFSHRIIIAHGRGG